MDDDVTSAALPGLTEVTLGVRDLTHAFRELTARIARRLDMPVTDVTAVGLVDMLGPMTVGALASRLDIRTASATVLVDRLVAAGRAERRPHPTDRRSTLVHLTPAGRAESWGLWEPAIRAMDAVAADLPPEHRGVVSDYLRQIAEAVQRHP